MKSSAVGRAIRHFYKTTTLHGFKYLCSKYYCDRVGWLLCCVASACCAGVLCAVLWARFLQVPAVLTLHDMRGANIQMKLPTVAVCPPPQTVARLFEEKFSSSNNTKRLSTILMNVLRRRFPSLEQLGLLENFLDKEQMTIQQVLMAVVPSCENIVLNCRWQYDIVSCEKLFKKELTEWGVCCVMRPENVNLPKVSLYETTSKLHIAVKCSDEVDTVNGCQFFTGYKGEEWVEPKSLTPGFNYLAQMSFTSVIDKDSDKLVDGTCVTTEGYTKRECLLKCIERICGCADPIRSLTTKTLPYCQVTQLKCLHSFKTVNASLGGVFNMFLGVGLFSALEVLFLLCVRLPIEIKKSTEIENVSPVQ
ncbi:unnamed protein product [Danaus chrysippus]|uniref:(African queen) hypothetical protein n=1 Tax=Danaus chrysippus TaxID=151541 RepID=A0A8J2W0Q8_9NEOP|nr:unnamed protein product [Danaus chrysippus]